DPVAELVGDPLDRPVIGAQLGTELAHQPHCLRLLVIAVATRRRLPRRSLRRHDSILVSKVRSLQRTQGGSSATRCAPRASSRAASASMSAASMSRCMRFLVVLGSGTCWRRSFGTG